MNISSSYCLRVSIGSPSVRRAGSPSETLFPKRPFGQGQENPWFHQAPRTKPKHGESFYFSSKSRQRPALPQNRLGTIPRGFGVFLGGGGNMTLENWSGHEKIDVAGSDRRDHRRRRAGCAPPRRRRPKSSATVPATAGTPTSITTTPPRAGIVVHDDNWRWRGRDHYRWREHEGRGYWRNGIWLNF